MNKPTHLIINNPYVMPRRYWKYDRQRQSFEEAEGRRPAGYTIATPNYHGHDDPGFPVEIKLVNQIRPRVDAWREAKYPGITPTTKQLLEHWSGRDRRGESNPFFFCQLEAIETLVWLTEAPAAERVGIDVPGDGGPFTRLCSKMATGSGKTIVMAMIVAWQVLNKAANNQDPRYSKNVLLIAPGLTVRKRLEVLKPEGPDNYYDLFNVVPDSLMQALRSHGRIRIINWHKFAWETEAKLAKKKGVDKRGPRSDDAWLRDVLADMAKARNLVVINDEAHHAWRVPAGASVDVSKEQKDEATKWVGGLDRIQKARGILTCFDLSATPFVPSGKKSSEEALYGWIVSDFGLTDAIESGLVKTPRVVVRGDAVPDAATYKSKLYHIYAASDEHGNRIRDDLNRDAAPEESLPQLVLNAYLLLGKDWLETRKAWHAEWEKKGRAEGRPFVPPVMITVANRIETASRVKHAFDHEDVLIPELCDPEWTLQIDSDALNKAEAQDEAIAAGDAGGGGGEDVADADAAPVKKLTKLERVKRMREMVNTVGKAGGLGGQLQNVISVAMLSEGWDARTVTHIMGLRAFTSQLLCEQVVGRGLRRTNYDIEKGGIGEAEEPVKGKGAGTMALPFLFKPEYVNVFGVPFSFMPHEEADGTTAPTTNTNVLVEAVAARAEQFQISWPQVARIEHALTPTLWVDWSGVPVLTIEAAHITQLAELAPVVAGKPDTSKIQEIDLRNLGEKFRLQKVVFETARKLFEEEKPAWRGSPDILLGQLVQLVDAFVRSGQLSIVPELFAQNDLHRRVLLALSMSRIVQHLKTAIHEGNTQSRHLVLDETGPVRSTGDMRPWFTSKPNQLVKRSHINRCVFDSTWEAAEAYWLDHDDTQGMVSAWAKNDHLGFEVRYIFAGGVSKYRPDFLIRLRSGRVLLLEVKGQDTPRDKAKRAALGEWVDAVNADGRFGQWCHDVSFSPSDVLDILTRHAGRQ